MGKTVKIVGNVQSYKSWKFKQELKNKNKNQRKQKRKRQYG